MTDKGYETLRSAWPICEQTIAEQFNVLSDDEKKTLLTFLKRMNLTSTPASL
jgi:hypothetical protein